ncbi:MAG: AraC family transcriptional regulator [Opitutaceae bacterium]|nr:AraC family transcriptional regulator [Opitutaceae bacterium]
MSRLRPSVSISVSSRAVLASGSVAGTSERPLAQVDPEAPMHAWGGLRSELLWVYDGLVEEAARDVVTDRRHGYWTWLLLEGAVRVGEGRGAVRAKAGEWIVCPHEAGRQVFEPGSRIVSVHFRAQWPSGENLFVGSQAHVFPAPRYPKLERTARALCRIAGAHFPGVTQHLLIQSTDYRTFWRLQKTFAQWLLDFSDALVAEGRVFAQSGECDPRVVRAAHCLNSAPLNEPFPGERLRQETGLGRARIEQLFYEQFGLHTKEYWNRLRAQAAMHDLEDGGRSVKEVCHRVGFKQPSHFTKWFAQQAGVSPLAYRNQIMRKRETAGV